MMNAASNKEKVMWVKWIMICFCAIFSLNAYAHDAKSAIDTTDTTSVIHISNECKAKMYFYLSPKHNPGICSNISKKNAIIIEPKHLKKFTAVENHTLPNQKKLFCKYKIDVGPAEDYSSMYIRWDEKKYRSVPESQWVHCAPSHFFGMCYCDIGKTAKLDKQWFYRKSHS